MRANRYEGEPPIRTRIVKQGQKSERRKVLQRTVQYSREKGHEVILGERLMGYLPPNCDDLDMMEKVENPKRGRPRTKPAESPNSAEESGKILDATDERNQSRATYPLDIVYLVMVMATGSGMDSCDEVAQFWESHMDELSRVFPDLPRTKVSHDLIRKFYGMLGKIKDSNLVQSLDATLLHHEGVRQEVEAKGDPQEKELFRKNIQAFDDLEASQRKQPGSKDLSYLLNVYMCNGEVVLSQLLVGDTTNDIAHARENVNQEVRQDAHQVVQQVVQQMDIRGSIVTADAMRANSEFIQAVLEGGADYCIELMDELKDELTDEQAGEQTGEQGNQKTDVASVQTLFNAKKWLHMVVADQKLNQENGLYEQKILRVLPGSLVDADILEKWPGLEEGSIVEVTLKRFDTEKDISWTETRYFISSLYFNKKYIARQMRRVIRTYMQIEDKAGCLFGIVYDYECIHCNNADYLAGKRLMNIIVDNIASIAMKNFEEMGVL